MTITHQARRRAEILAERWQESCTVWEKARLLAQVAERALAAAEAENEAALESYDDPTGPAARKARKALEQLDKAIADAVAADCTNEEIKFYSGEYLEPGWQR